MALHIILDWKYILDNNNEKFWSFHFCNRQHISLQEIGFSLSREYVQGNVFLYELRDSFRPNLEHLVHKKV